MLTAVFTAVLSGAVRAPDVASTNITPDPSGISYYDLAMFMQAMRTGFVGARKLSQIMPWHLPRDDRRRYRGIFAYIKTFKPVRHHVDNTGPPTYCKLCRQTHGGGNEN
jgi:hypothetical protein